MWDKFFFNEFLLRLTNSIHVDKFILKGGFLFEKIVTLSNRTTLDVDFSYKIINVTKEHLKKEITEIISNQDNSLIYFDEITAQINNATSDYEKKQNQERLAKLTGGIAIIKVGAATESELKEKKLRIEDALNATKAAIAEGIVVVGGEVLVEIHEKLKETLKHDNQDVYKGIKAVLDSLIVSTYQIAENAGYEGSSIVEKQKKQETNHGFDAKEGKWVDLIKTGIIDPTRVTRNPVLNASSIASLLITTEAAVIDLKEEQNITPVSPY